MKKEDAKICLAYPSPDYVHVGFVSCLLNMFHYCMVNKIHVAVGGMQGSRITVNRNALVELAKASKATHILFIDADMVFQPDMLEKLLAYDKDIVCATACKRDGSGKALGSFVINEADKVLDEKGSFIRTGGLIEAKQIGCPFMLIKMEVFDKLKKPYFAEPPLGDFPEGEDLYFCRLVREAGYKIWCDIDMSKQLGHIGTKVFYIDKVETENPSASGK